MPPLTVFGTLARPCWHLPERPCPISGCALFFLVAGGMPAITLAFPLFSPKPQPTRLTGSQCRLMKVRGYAVSKQLVQFIWKEIHAHEVCGPVNTAGWVCLLFCFISNNNFFPERTQYFLCVLERNISFSRLPYVNRLKCASALLCQL